MEQEGGVDVVQQKVVLQRLAVRSKFILLGGALAYFVVFLLHRNHSCLDRGMGHVTVEELIYRYLIKIA